MLNNQLIPFDFYGDQLLVADEHGEIHVSILRVCEGLGLSAWAQLRKLEAKEWATTVMMTVVAADGRQREHAMLHIDSLPMWLATINDRKVAPEVRPKLVRYQLECAQVLRDHFLRRRETPAAPQQLDLPWTSFDIIDAKNLEKTLKSAFKMKAITRDEYQVAVRGVLHRAGIIEHLELSFINDPWAPAVASALYGEWITTSDALLIVGAERTRANEMRMARVLRTELGLKKIRSMTNHVRVSMYVRGEEVDA